MNDHERHSPSDSPGAIYHFSAKVISRKNGQSTVAASAYRAGVELVDEKTGEVKDYTKKRGVDHAEIIAPSAAPEWATDRQALWNRLEDAERRKDARLARHYDMALPTALDRDQQLALVREFVREHYPGQVVDMALHDLDSHNPHAHLMAPEREIGPEGFGAKPRQTPAERKERLITLREGWAECCNRALERAGHRIRVDHRSLEAQGLDHTPQVHRGPRPGARIKEQFAAIQAANQHLQGLKASLMEAEAKGHEAWEAGRRESEARKQPEKAPERPKEVPSELKRESDPAVIRRREEDELLKELGLTDSAQAGLRLKELEHSRESAKRARDRAKKAIEDFNNRFDNMNLFKKMNPFSNMHRAGQALEDEWEKHDKHHNFLEKEKERLQKGYKILWERERPERERRDAEEARKLERDNQIRIENQRLKEKQRVPDKGRDFER